LSVEYPDLGGWVSANRARLNVGHSRLIGGRAEVARQASCIARPIRHLIVRTVTKHWPIRGMQAALSVAEVLEGNC